MDGRRGRKGKWEEGREGKLELVWKMRKDCFKIRKNEGSGAGEMAQHEDLSSVAGTHMVGGEK